MNKNLSYGTLTVFLLSCVYLGFYFLSYDYSPTYGETRTGGQSWDRSHESNISLSYGNRGKSSMLFSVLYTSGKISNESKSNENLVYKTPESYSRSQATEGHIQFDKAIHFSDKASGYKEKSQGAHTSDFRYNVSSLNNITSLGEVTSLPTSLHSFLYPIRNYRTINYSPTVASTNNWNISKSVPYIPVGSVDLKSFHDRIPRHSDRKLPREIHQDQYDNLIRLISVFQKVMSDLKISWMVYYGSLLGSLVTHDVLPWDDDMDTLVEQSGMDFLNHLEKNGTLRERYGVTYKCSYSLCKVFFANEPSMSNFGYPWKWPFVDMVPFKIEGSLIKNLDRKKPENAFSLPKDWALPTHLRPMGPLWLPCPKDPWRLLSFTYRNYKGFKCQNGNWNHLRETSRDKVHSPSCNELKDSYPFVWREASGNMTRETLWMADQPMYTTVIDDPYYSINPFEWQYIKSP